MRSPASHIITKKRRRLRVITVAITTLVVYIVSLWLTGVIRDQTNILAESWTGGWLEGFVFGTWNAISSTLELSAVAATTERNKRFVRTELGARWMARNDILKSISCLCMSGAGYTAMLRIPEPVIPLLMLGGLVSAANLILDRLDREDLEEVIQSSSGTSE